MMPNEEGKFQHKITRILGYLGRVVEKNKNPTYLLKSYKKVI